jgi:hypothetical protein
MKLGEFTTSKASRGPKVSVNKARCDALALVEDGSAEMHVSVINIPLERFSHEKCQKMYQTLTGLLSSTGVRERNNRKIGRAQSSANSDAKFKAILGILWNDVVKPVIEGLAFQVCRLIHPYCYWLLIPSHQTTSERPPVSGSATGLLAFLPIHAAGLCDVQEIGEKVSDYVVSSYTPTLTAILELSDPVVREDFQVLTVAKASAPGAQPIPKTEDGVKIVQNITASARVLNLTRGAATVQRVRDDMIEGDRIHLACHGQQHPNDPMDSGFLLHDKILKLSEIVKWHYRRRTSLGLPDSYGRREGCRGIGPSCRWDVVLRMSWSHCYDMVHSRR